MPMPPENLLQLRAAKQLLLDAHKEYLESNGERGARLDFSGADLKKSRFDGVNFKGASFVLSYFKDADVEGAHLDEVKGNVVLNPGRSR